MSIIANNITENSIEIIKGISRKKDTIFEEKQNSDLSYLYKQIDGKKEFVGVKINNFFTEIELAGAEGELKFKLFLESNKIPYLYVGQGAVGVDKSETLLHHLGSKRPDFFVNLPNLGYIFVDVKTRKRLGFANSDITYFSLFCSEIDELFLLHSHLLIPVWIAFFERDSNSEDSFYFVPISRIHELKDKIIKSLSQEESCLLSSLRIPNEFLMLTEQELKFTIGLSTIVEEQCAIITDNYRGLFRVIKSRIFEVIRQGNAMKSKIGQSVSEMLQYTFKFEIDHIVEILIDKREILYESRKPLRLVGE